MLNNLLHLPRTITALVALVSIAACEDPQREASKAALPVASEGVASEDNSVYTQSGTWTNQRGDTIRLESLAGRVRVVAMVYTNCHSACPLVVAEMKRIEAAVPIAKHDRVGFVLISLDPERDSPARMTEWAASIGLDPTSWTILAGAPSAVREMSALLNVRYQHLGNGEFAHTNGLTVLDENGVIAHQQNAFGESAESIASVIQLVNK